MIRWYRNWRRRKRRERSLQEKQQTAARNGIMRLYQERGEVPHPAVIEGLMGGLPYHMRAYSIGELGAELARIGWIGDEARAMLTREYLKLGLPLRDDMRSLVLNGKVTVRK